MRLSSPKKVTWWVALVIGLAGILAFIIGIFVHIPCVIIPLIPFFMMLGFILVTAGFIIYALSTALKGL